MDIEERILEDLCNGVFIPGKKLNIAALIKRYEMGKAPVREALARLMSTGLLSCEDNKGYTVKPITAQDLLEVHEAFMHVEALALSQSMERGDEGWERQIAGALYSLEKLELAQQPPDFEQWEEANSYFHDSLAAAASPIVLELRELLKVRIRRYVRLAFASQRTQLSINFTAHQDLADAVLKKETKQALKLLEAHLKDASSAILDNLKEILS